MKGGRVVSICGFLLFLLPFQCLYPDGEYLKQLISGLDSSNSEKKVGFTLLYIADSDKSTLLGPACEQCLRNCC